MKNEVSACRLGKTANSPVEGVVVIDTETTGLEPGKDEVLSIAIVDLDGNALFYSLIRPLERKRWPKATEVHGITWKDVKDKPTIYDVGNEISDILENASLIVGYNVDFDMDMLTENGLPNVNTNRYDLMEEFAQAYGRWSDRKCGYLWCKLEQCARHFGYEFTAHNALEDAKATAYCYKMFRDECARAIPEAEKRDQKKRQIEEQFKIQEAERIAAAEDAAKLARKKKMIAKTVCIAVILGSIAAFMNSCSIAGGDILGSLAVMVVSTIVFFVGFCGLFI